MSSWAYDSKVENLTSVIRTPLVPDCTLLIRGQDPSGCVNASLNFWSTADRMPIAYGMGESLIFGGVVVFVTDLCDF